MTHFWVGLDVGEALTCICATDSFGERILETTTPSAVAEIATVLLSIGPPHDTKLVVEAGMANYLARSLREMGFSVLVLDAGRARRFLEIRRNKTDENDARGLAEMGRLRNVPGRPVHVKDAACQHLRSKLVVRDLAMRQRTAVDLSIRTLLREHGGDRLAAPPRKSWQENLPIALESLKNTGVDLSGIIFPLVAVRQALTECIVSANADFSKIIAANSVLRNLVEIPGVGPICALSFYTAIDDPNRFSRAADVGAYFGLVPRVKQSGTILQRSRITKAGSKMTRGHLVMAANVVLAHAKTRSELGDWGRALKDRVGYTKAKVAVARKLAVLMFSVWKNESRFMLYPKSVSGLVDISLDPGHMSGASTSNQEVGPRQFN